MVDAEVGAGPHGRVDWITIPMHKSTTKKYEGKKTFIVVDRLRKGDHA